MIFPLAAASRPADTLIGEEISDLKSSSGLTDSLSLVPKGQMLNSSPFSLKDCDNHTDKMHAGIARAG
jgi:hypothetical protein